MNQKKTYTLFMVVCLLFFLTLGLIIFTPASLQRIVLAATGNYNRTAAQNSLTMSDWNLLDTDFLMTDGTNAMASDLNMNNHKITNLSTPTANTDAATKQYVDNNGSSGAIFTNWGRGDCPSGTTLLYGGYAFSNHAQEYPGAGTNLVCIKSPLVGTEVPIMESLTGYLYSVGTGQARSLPGDIPELKEMKCAVCHKPAGSCYENYGDNACGSGFTAAYTGWLLGGLSNVNRKAEIDWRCVNDNFDGGTANNNYTSLIYGGTIQGDADVSSYTKKVFLRCSICCN